MLQRFLGQQGRQRAHFQGLRLNYEGEAQLGQFPFVLLGHRQQFRVQIDDHGNKQLLASDGALVPLLF